MMGDTTLCDQCEAKRLKYGVTQEDLASAQLIRTPTGVDGAFDLLKGQVRQVEGQRMIIWT